jgi:hypothetical protein
VGRPWDGVTATQFIATNYLDPAFRHDWHAITGCDRNEFVELMQQIDDLGW